LAAWLPVVAATRQGFPHERSEDAQHGGEDRWIELVDGIQYSRAFSKGACRYDVPLDTYIEVCADWYARQAKEHEVAGIHSASFAYNGLASVLAGRQLGLPVVYEVRGLQYITTRSLRQEWGGSEAELLDQRLEWAAALEADLVFTLNTPMREELARLGVPHEKITIVPNGVDTSRFRPRKRDTEVSASLRLDGKFVFGYIGSFLDYEGLGDLVDAVAMVREGGAPREFAVIVVGSGPEEDRLRRKVARLGLEGIITLVGQVSHARIEKYLSVCDVTVYPRRKLEVCELVTPTKPFEAMAMGVCPLMSDVAALAEIAGGGARGRLFRAGDAESLAAALEGLLASPEDVAAKGQAARQWVESERSWEAVGREVVAKYQELGMVGWNEAVSASRLST
jgi:glycosyltransferase involved in cell wall biosynthesis